MRSLLGQMMLLPFVVGRYVLEMMGSTARGLEQIADDSLRDAFEPRAAEDLSYGPFVPPREPLPTAVRPDPTDSSPELVPWRPPISQSPTAPETPASENHPSPFASTTTKENIQMSDTNLNDQMVKLVEYTILTIEREKEKLLEGPKQVLVTDDLTGNAFSNARIAEWTANRSSEEKKIRPSTLRVYYNVMERWPKEDLKFDEKTVSHDEEQLKILQEIADRLPPKPSTTTPSRSGSAKTSGAKGSKTP